MAVRFLKDRNLFLLTTPNSLYAVGITDKEGFVGSVYYGARIREENLNYLLRTEEPPYVPSENERERCSFMDFFPCEYPGFGLGDYRTPAFMIRREDGAVACGINYVSHKIYSGKPSITGLPATFGPEETVSTLEIECQDEANELTVTLVYSAFEDCDAIVRSVRIRNDSPKMITLTKVMSMSLDFDNKEFDTMVLHGTWARERHRDRNKLGYGTMTVSSFRGESSHQEHPFLGLFAKDCGEDSGEAYGFHFVYSGNFAASAQLSQFDSVRVSMGINPEGFEWGLNPGETFETPEVCCVYSADGIGQMSRTYHDLYRNHLIRSKYRDCRRPVLINNWEATYFDFNSDKLYDIAKEASALGVEMLVMDDGWFGKRNSDNCSLGDWTVNEEKLPGGLSALVERVNRLGMKFGIWFEPEMISPDSKLYRSHPDWAVSTPGRIPAKSRCQYVLDLTRSEVRDYVFESLRKVLKSANIEYVKWDMNRQLTELYSSHLSPEHMGEFFHRYCLGVYDLQERFVTEFPDILLENCSGGGARFDPGMLYYSPQIWCSDNTDAIARLEIQQGTEMIYPIGTIGAHVSDCPNHSVGRSTPFDTRGIVALSGTFGYELDITKISQEDRDRIPGQIALSKRFSDLIRRGDYYRLRSFAQTHKTDAWMIVSKDRTNALVTYIQVLGEANCHSDKLYLRGLDPEKRYEIEEIGSDCLLCGQKVLFGDALMKAGILLKCPWGDYRAILLFLNQVP